MNTSLEKSIDDIIKDLKTSLQPSKWVLVTAAPLKTRALMIASKPLLARPDLRVWTDDYSNVVQILKW